MAPFSLQICPIIRDLIFTPRISLLLPERITSNLPLTCRYCKSSTYLSLRNLSLLTCHRRSRATPDRRSQTENVQQLSVSTYRISKTHIGCTGTHTRVQDRDLQLFVVKPTIRFYGGALLIVVTSSLRLTSDGGNINVPLSR
ncbi:hypothetical protein FOYG_08732 [Fusarium oxysporum NRRL 32931]|uniref:Uncharacterized protein n=1 Tax=Fusarium oxysporum NRRL 32931 TaxID=660029 RepID=W9IFX6_FUSOX|nr:hypothetical protein FOYG_08732 [Fusarium oxysporum NRRL 32931]